MRFAVGAAIHYARICLVVIAQTQMQGAKLYCTCEMIDTCWIETQEHIRHGKKTTSQLINAAFFY